MDEWNGDHSDSDSEIYNGSEDSEIDEPPILRRMRELRWRFTWTLDEVWVVVPPPDPSVDNQPEQLTPCVICMDHFRTTRTVPCGHFVMCSGCALELVYNPPDPMTMAPPLPKGDARCPCCRCLIGGLRMVPHHRTETRVQWVSDDDPPRVPGESASGPSSRLPEDRLRS